MNKLKYYYVKLLSKIKKEKTKETVNKYFRKCGIKIGKQCNICSDIVTSEPYLIEIGSNVTIGGHVELITHDNSISKIMPEKTDLFGKIVIGDN